MKQGRNIEARFNLHCRGDDDLFGSFNANHGHSEFHRERSNHGDNDKFSLRSARGLLRDQRGFLHHGRNGELGNVRCYLDSRSFRPSSGHLESRTGRSDLDSRLRYLHRELRRGTRYHSGLLGYGRRLSSNNRLVLHAPEFASNSLPNANRRRSDFFGSSKRSSNLDGRNLVVQGTVHNTVHLIPDDVSRRANQQQLLGNVLAVQFDSRASNIRDSRARFVFRDASTSQVKEVRS